MLRMIPGAFFLLILVTGCTTRLVQRTVTYYEPVYLSWEDLRSSVNAGPAREIGKTGKIYLKDGWIFMSEPDLGIHIIDNKDPARPRQHAFLNIPGNKDMAILGNTLYADSYIDLVSIDIGTLFVDGKAHVLNRITNLFPYPYPDYYVPRRYWYNNVRFSQPDPAQGIVTNWKAVKSENYWYFEDDRILYSRESPSAGRGAGNTGTAGSMARFITTERALYTVDWATMKVFDITRRGRETHVTNIQLSNNIETIFPYDDYLFIGSMGGMGLYRVPGQTIVPEFVTWVNHRFSRDPVIFDGRFAYVTLFRGELQVLDMKNLTNPAVTNIYQLYYPQGLGMIGRALYVCTEYGLAVYDASRAPVLYRVSNLQNSYDPDWPESRALYQPFTNYNGWNDSWYDCIPYGSNLLVSARQGLYNLDCSSPWKPRVLSVIPATNAYPEYHWYR